MSLRHPHTSRCPISCQLDGAKTNGTLKPAQNLRNGISLYDEESKERIKTMFKKADFSVSVSSYDTAWMAMVPSTVNPQNTPQFPSCLNWVLTNQLSDGSWGLYDTRDTSLIKDPLSSTLACVLALKQWGVGELQIAKGMEFIASKSAFVSDDNLLKPVGFDIIFPAMIEQAKSLNLNIPLRQEDLVGMQQRRNLELATSSMDFSEGRKAYLSYISEGMGKNQNWEMAMKYQRKNGSLFNSPSATAAAFSHLQNTECLQYLNLLLEKFDDAVPAVYPLAVYSRLWMVENLEKLGIHRHFKEEIENVLYETYRYWIQGDEEIFEDTTTFAMAFRLLRSHGYDVSSDALSQFAEEDHFRDTLEGYLSETSPVLELYKASQMMIDQNEVILEGINSWTGRFLRQRQLSFLKNASKEVEHALRFPYRANLERVANRRNIEHYDEVNTRMLKSATRSYIIGNKDFRNLAVEEFNKSQLINQEELKYLGRWVVENRLDKLKFARQKLGYCYFSAAATLTDPKLSDARISWAKNGVLTTVVDDFFDLGGSEEELQNLIQLIEKWNVDVTTECCSENVGIIYSALRSTICEIGDKAFAFQGRDVTPHVAEIWLDLLNSMLREAEWTREKSVPTMDEYMANGFVSFALGPIVLPTLYLIGPRLSEDAAKSPGTKNLYELMSTCGRLLNDVQGFKRESEEGKPNAVSLKVTHSNGAVNEEEAMKMIKGMISSKRKQLLRCVLEEDKGSFVIPRACRDLFWKMSTVLNFFYLEEDGFTSHKLVDVVKGLLEKPIGVDELRISGKTQ